MPLVNKSSIRKSKLACNSKFKIEKSKYSQYASYPYDTFARGGVMKRMVRLGLPFTGGVTSPPRAFDPLTRLYMWELLI